MEEKDKRFQLMNEILAGIKVIKMYAWEPSFETKVTKHRNGELRDIKVYNNINAFGALCWLMSVYWVCIMYIVLHCIVIFKNAI